MNNPSRTSRWCFIALGLAMCASGPAWALYKVVGPDGRVTYTDRPPTDQPSVTIKTNGSTVSTDGLPFELQRVISRYPVTLFTSAKCTPCDSARQLLQGRGIPYAEKTVDTNDDIRLFQQQEGALQLPILKVGSKQLVGFAEAEWMSYLDVAGYPSKSVLPPSYRSAKPSPLAPPTATPETKNVKPDTAAEPSTEPSVKPAAPNGFRF